MGGRTTFVARARSVAGLTLALTPTTLAQPPIELGGGLLGGAASYLPSIPLSPAAQTNLAAQSLRTGGDGTWQSQISYAHGMEFVTINVPGNPTRPGVTNPGALGSGQVTQAFAISRFEANNALWRQFMGAVGSVRDSGQFVPFLVTPQIAGGANAQMLPVGGVSWRTAAMFCNWLHNDRQTSLAALSSGAYDISTFGGNGNGFTDQLVASPGARFRMPTLNESLVASHFDPNGISNPDGSTSARWWGYNTTSDTAPVYGPPGALINGQPAQANAGPESAWPVGAPSPFSIPLGAYDNTQSPWGLLDTAGGTSEWTEGTRFDPDLGGYQYRYFMGSYRGDRFAGHRDRLGAISADFPDLAFPEFGFRVVMTIPTPSAGGVVLVGLLALSRRVRRGL
jgi:hypothetical protein